MLRKADSSNGEIAMHLGLVTLHVLMESGLCLAAKVALATGGDPMDNDMLFNANTVRRR